MTGFASVRRVVVPRAMVHETHLHLRNVGLSGHEGFVLWAGKNNGDRFGVSKVLIPAQEGLRSELGVCVRVEGEELHRINVWLFENGLRLIAQIHSHPTDAYHSDTDDAFPIVTTEGALSLVAPNFATGPADLAHYAAYRLVGGRWVELSSSALSGLINIQDS